MPPSEAMPATRPSTSWATRSSRAIRAPTCATSTCSTSPSSGSDLMRIADVRARQLLDCKCRPLVEVEVICEDGSVGRGAAPTGTSVGMYEAFVLRDGDPKQYRGLSVHTAVGRVRDVIAPALVGRDVFDQRAIDQVMIELDGTPHKSRLGGNAIYSTSIAVLRAACASRGIPVYRHLAREPLRTIPIPSFNMMNGGRYGDVVQAFNEFIVIPYKADSIYAAVEMSVNLFSELERVLTKHLGRAPQVARSYGYVATSANPEQVLTVMAEAIASAGYTGTFAFALDCASSEMYDPAT